MKGEYISIETSKIMADIEEENKELHDRIDKAIEHIEETINKWEDYEQYYEVVQEDKFILKILKGE